MRWELSNDEAEREALTALGAACPEQRLPSVDDQR
jgi:hypothetical protein